MIKPVIRITSVTAARRCFVISLSYITQENKNFSAKNTQKYCFCLYQITNHELNLSRKEGKETYPFSYPVLINPPYAPGFYLKNYILFWLIFVLIVNKRNTLVWINIELNGLRIQWNMKPLLFKKIRKNCALNLLVASLHK